MFHSFHGPDELNKLASLQYTGLHTGSGRWGGGGGGGVDPESRTNFSKFPNHVLCSRYFPNHVLWENVF